MINFQFRSNHYSLKIHKGFLLLCLVFVIFFLLMSFWQLHRYYYKKSLINTYETRLNAIPLPFNLVQPQDDLQFKHIAVDGEYDNELLMFIQNRFHDGKMGYEVLTPIRIKDSQKLLLIDRGWIKKPDDGSLPIISNVQSTQHISGYIKTLSEYQFILGQNIIDSESKPLIMQKIDLQEVSRITKKDFYPYILRLDPEAENGFVREWIISAMLPARHMMYALQWLAFSFVVLIGLFYFSLERRTHE